jgi:hypothetical protein
MGEEAQVPPPAESSYHTILVLLSKATARYMLGLKEQLTLS